jgi:hypothetical protein
MPVEYAYYQTIGALLSRHVNLLISNSDKANWLLHCSDTAETKVYICGDSHVLPLSWQMIPFHWGDTLSIPRLTTGIKHYHLRKLNESFITRFMGQLARGGDFVSLNHLSTGGIDVLKGTEHFYPQWCFLNSVLSLPESSKVMSSSYS